MFNINHILSIYIFNIDSKYSAHCLSIGQFLGPFVPTILPPMGSNSLLSACLHVYVTVSVHARLFQKAEIYDLIIMPKAILFWFIFCQNNMIQIVFPV